MVTEEAGSHLTSKLRASGGANRTWGELSSVFLGVVEQGVP